MKLNELSKEHPFIRKLLQEQEQKIAIWFNISIDARNNIDISHMFFYNKNM